MLITEIITYLSTEISGINLTGKNGNIFMGNLPPTPETVVTVKSSGGFEADTKLQYDMPMIQVIVRGTKDPRIGYNLALEIYDKLHAFRNGPFVIGGLYIVSCIGIQSEPVDIGTDEKGRYRYSQNYQLDVLRTSEHR